MARYKELKRHKITIVFDGWIEGDVTEEHQREKGVYIIYSRRGEKADEVIKRMAKNSGEEMVVVTSDRDIADSIARAGCVAIPSLDFEDRMNEEEHMAFSNDCMPEEDDDYFKYGRKNKKKGASRRKSKKERIRQRKLEKL
jgi:hypothetical protein